MVEGAAERDGSDVGGGGGGSEEVRIRERRYCSRWDDAGNRRPQTMLR